MTPNLMDYPCKDEDNAQLLEKMAAFLEKIEQTMSLEQGGESCERVHASPGYIKGGKLRDYQLQGLNWMIALYNSNLNGILADEMGLGKTLQTIAFLGYLRHFRHIRGPFLVVVPKSTLANWLAEFKHWCPSLKVVSIKGDKETRKQVIKDVIQSTKWEVCVTSYEMVSRERATLSKYNWQFLVVDEAHRLKNEASQLSLELRKLHSFHRLLLTGTPLQNNLHELWSLLNFLLPNLFDASNDFEEWFQNPNCLGDEKVIKRIHRILKPFLLRRLKTEVEKTLPPKKEVKIYAGIGALQKQIYKRILLNELEVVNSEGKVSKARIQNVLIQLRKVCNHPYLIEGVEKGPPYTTDEHLIEASEKLKILDKLLPKLKAKGSRILIFSQMTTLLNILEDYLLFRGYQYCRLDGQTSFEDRESAIEGFNKKGSDKFVFLLSTRAGGLGINLVTADVVILYDSDWNPQMDLQAMDRAHRIGQTKMVKVFRLVTKSTVEERMVERAEIKLRLDKIVIQNGRALDTKTKLDKDEMLGMIRFGAKHILDSTDAEVTEEDIDKILAKAEQLTEETKEKLDGMNENSLQSLSFDTPWEVYKFEGVDYNLERNNRRRETSFVTIPSEPTEYVEAKKKIFTVKKPRYPEMSYFKMYPKELEVLKAKETNYYLRSTEYQIEVPDDADEQTLEEIAQKQQSIDNAEPLTEEEELKKAELLKEGFSTWNKREYMAFFKAIRKYRKDDYAAFAADVQTKTEREIAQYAAVFWEKCSEFPDYERIRQIADKTEEKYTKRKLQYDLLAKKMTEAGNCFNRLKIRSGASRSKLSWTMDQDRYLLHTLHSLGYTLDLDGQLIREHLLRQCYQSFDYTLKTRTAEQVKDRCAILLNNLEKEAKESQNTRKNSSEEESEVKMDEAERPNGLLPSGLKRDLENNIKSYPPPKRVKLNSPQVDTIDVNMNGVRENGLLDERSPE
ncbi:SMARCA5 [Cordylochernes scorpioides]|uniref:SMARCA5 n=1 Tax=Cordylochernes scorpioides TaxID=51811 RepID=A0ABY6LKR0_9ARAC|nr:SMARCA5 [Cordylochernes scorpioides]